MNNPLHRLSIGELRLGLSNRQFSARELVLAYLDRITAHDARVRGFITVLGEEALHQADDVDRRLGRGEPLGPLAGIPIGVKDSIPTAGIRTTANSRVLSNWVPAHDALAIARLRAAGAIVLGKTNLNEFGWALPSEHDMTSQVMSPWNPAYAAIGSSSGSGIAVAAGFVAGAVGTDGGGSVRLPAGQNNLVGIKATHGLVERTGVDESWIADIAPMARTVSDTALMLSIMSGVPPVDENTLDTDVRGWRVGVPRQLIADAGLEAEVDAAFQSSLQALEALGIELVEIDSRGLAEARMANFVILNGQTHAQHAVSLARHPERYGRSARVYHWMGAFLSAKDLLNARAVALHVRALLEDGFHHIRAIVTPTSPVVTAEAARAPAAHRRGSNAIFTSPFNATGHPALSIPSGFSDSTGLPIGLQIVGALHDEMTLFQLARALEQKTDLSCRQPSF